MGSKIENTKSSPSSTKATPAISSSSTKIKHIRNGEGQSMVAPHPAKKK